MAKPQSTNRSFGNNRGSAATAVRNTAIPKAQSSAPRVVTYEMIARRAYEISQSAQCGSEFDNWIRAERELRGR